MCPSLVIYLVLPIRIVCIGLRCTIGVVELQGIHRGRNTCVGYRIQINSTPLLRAEHIEFLRYGLQAGTIPDVHTQAVFLRTLGRDNNDTIGSTRTIDGGRSRILEHLNRLDIARVQRTQVLIGGNTINHIQGVASVNRTDTTDTDTCPLRARRSIGVHLNTRQTPLQAAEHVRITLAGRLGHIHHAHRSRQVGFTLRGVARYNQLLQLLRILRHTDHHIGDGRQSLVLVTDITN